MIEKKDVVLQEANLCTTVASNALRLRERTITHVKLSTISGVKEEAAERQLHKSAKTV